MSSYESTAELLKSKIPEIMHRWEEQARLEVSATLGLTSLVLRNALPRFLDSLVQALETSEKTEVQLDLDAAEILAATKEHGKGRAKLPLYVMSQMIVEYQILRKTVFACLEENGQLSQRDRDIIMAFAERAVNVAATEFAASLKRAQELFFLSIAHDLKTPLVVVKLATELRAKIPSEEMNSKIAAQEKASIDRMTRMIDRILDTTKIQTGEPLELHFQECDLSPIISDVVEEFNLIHGDIITVKADASVTGKWDAEYLRRVIDNLLDNALKYRAHETPVLLTLRQTEAKAIIEVRNLGNVISAQDQVRIFDPLWRSEKTKNQSGWGIGLSFVRGVVDGHGGSLRVESSEEKGTTFVVELPRAESKRLAG
jgi:signal transduction histidine kinase